MSINFFFFAIKFALKIKNKMHFPSRIMLFTMKYRLNNQINVILYICHLNNLEYE